MNQSHFLAITCNSLEAREKSRAHDAIGFAFASHWLKNWRDSFKPITKRSNSNHVITFDSHLKTSKSWERKEQHFGDIMTSLSSLDKPSENSLYLNASEVENGVKISSIFSSLGEMRHYSYFAMQIRCVDKPLENSVYLNAFELENGVMMSPKRRSFLSLTFTCLCLTKPLLIKTKPRMQKM